MNCKSCPHKIKDCPCLEKTIKDIVRIEFHKQNRNETDINMYMRERYKKRHRKQDRGDNK